MSIQIQSIKNLAQKRFTKIRLIGRASKITVEIESERSIAEDKVIALSFIRHMKPWLQYFSYVDPEYREKSAKRACSLMTQTHRRGFEIRLRRLKIGLSQRELASHAAVTQYQISQIERGKISARPETIRRIEAALSLNQTKETENLRENGL